MFWFLGRKNYLVTRDSFKPYHQYCSIDDIKDFSNQFVDLEHLINHNFSPNPNDTTQIVVGCEDFDYLTNVWCEYLGLDYYDYLTIYDYNRKCIKYYDEFRLCDRTDHHEIASDRWNTYRRRTIRDINTFPAELFINRLDSPLVERRYLYFATYSIYNAIKEYQISLIETGQSIPCWCDQFASGVDTDANKLFDTKLRYRILTYLAECGRHVDGYHGCSFDSVHDEVVAYVKHAIDFGFIDTLRFKFNRNLATRLRENCYIPLCNLEKVVV